MKSSLSSYIYADETAVVKTLLAALDWDKKRISNVQKTSVRLVEGVRKRKSATGQLESFLQQFPLTSVEGLSLMSLAEALLRIPDSKTADALIKDKIAAANWLASAGGVKVEGGRSQKKSGGNWMTKAAGIGLSLTQKTLGTKLSGIGQPIIREAIIQAIRILGRQFVLGQDMSEALKRGADFQKRGYRFSYDMLGEGARTSVDAERYFTAYMHAIDFIGQNVPHSMLNGQARPCGISIKLSALHPRYEYAHRDVCVPALTEKLMQLCRKASSYNMDLTVDAEEVDRLEISLNIIGNILSSGEFKSWDGFGLALQAYQKRAFYLIDRLAEISRAHGQNIRVRLVKGAYWDTEIKRAQVLGLPDYPVFTRKATTDVSYLACAQKLLSYNDCIFPMFATHNAHTIAAVLEMVSARKARFELQRLHGMGEGLYEVLEEQHKNTPVTIYAPVGSHIDLLPYLVRRLLENGANSSFVNQLMNEKVSPADIVRDPVEYVRDLEHIRHPSIPVPADLYRGEMPKGRKNSHGLDITEPLYISPVLTAVQDYTARKNIIGIGSLINGGIYKTAEIKDSTNPANSKDVIAKVYQADKEALQKAFDFAEDGLQKWSGMNVDYRAEKIEAFADLLEKNQNELIAILSREAGKTISDAHDEVREAVDFARYYANQGRALFREEGIILPGPTGESNRLYMGARGIFVCISPWNFPLAIFCGQVLAALAAGNSVLAKPADQTPLIAYRAVELMHQAGIPAHAVQLVIGRGSVIGQALIEHPKTAGVAFTGSTEVAQKINRTLAAKNGAIVPLIAETGGQNAMIVDSSALAEQVVDDVVLSAFGSAGQRCSALRIVCVQEEIADKIITMLKGAMMEISVGSPADLSTDVGPVIDDKARQELQKYIDGLKHSAKIIHEIKHDESLYGLGSFLAPIAFEIDDVSRLTKEQFGPILHVVRYKRADLDALIDKLNDIGYGLTFGVHSRIQSFQQDIARRMKVGNVYVNRSMIGAVVGVQPFGGQGLSGTGPKAGGPHYLHRFATEKTVSIDTTASGGNASLVCISE